MVTKRTFLSILLILAMLVGTSICGAQTVTTTDPLHDEDLAGVRFKSFANTGSREIYAGVPDLGVGTRRSETDITWVAGDNNVSFSYDQAADKLIAQVTNPAGSWTLEYPNLSTQVASLTSGTYDLEDLNIMQIDVVNRDNQTASLTDVYLDGISLGDFGVGMTGWNTWWVTDYCFGRGFEIVGTLQLAGTFSGDEVSKLEIKVGVKEADGLGCGANQPPAC